VLNNIQKIRTNVGKSKAKRSLGRTMRRWNDNIQMYLKNREWSCGVDSPDSG